MKVYLVDGTYELFRHHFGMPSRQTANGVGLGATRGVVSSVLAMLEGGVTHLGVATDHVVESFRNQLWPGYKTSAGMPPEILRQFSVVEHALQAMGVVVWPMVELEADDALASAAVLCGEDPRVEQIVICTPDKDLAQCVVDQRVVQLDRRTQTLIDAQGVRDKYGVAPDSIPEWLALVGDRADGFPGLPGWGKRSASVVLSHYGTIEQVPDDVDRWDPAVRKSVRGAASLASALTENRGRALLFRTLATLRIERGLLRSVEDLAWHGPDPDFERVSSVLGDPHLYKRATALAHRLKTGA